LISLSVFWMFCYFFFSNCWSKIDLWETWHYHKISYLQNRHKINVLLQESSFYVSRVFRRLPSRMFLYDWLFWKQRYYFIISVLICSAHLLKSKKVRSWADCFKKNSVWLNIYDVSTIINVMLETERRRYQNVGFLVLWREQLMAYCYKCKIIYTLLGLYCIIAWNSQKKK
jgi:hypothetical protein